MSNLLVEWQFWLLWILVNALTVILIVPPEPALLFLQNGFSVSVMSGAVLGLAQWLVLRNKVRGGRWWVLATNVGVVLGWWLSGVVGTFVSTALTDALLKDSITAVTRDFTNFNLSKIALFMSIPRFVDSIVKITISSTVVGFAQWFVLRRMVSKAGWWIVAMTLGTVFSIGLFWVAWFSYFVPLDSNEMWGVVVDRVLLPLVGLLGMFNIVGGAITGAVLIWLLRVPKVARSN